LHEKIRKSYNVIMTSIVWHFLGANLDPNDHKMHQVNSINQGAEDAEKSPGQDGVDRTTHPFGAGENHPGETNRPAKSVESSVKSGANRLIFII